VSTEAEIAKELDGLVDEVPKLLTLTAKAEDIVPFGNLYQIWYSRALKLVELLGPDRLEEFSSYYRIDPKRKSFSAGTYVIQDYVTGMGPATDVYDKPRWDIHNLVAIRLVNQSQILKSLKSRLESTHV
jgi:hypothetical protein